MILKSANLALSFLLELCVFAAFAYWGFNSGTGAVGTTLLGIGAPLLAIVFWGLFMAPRAAMRLSGLMHTVLTLVVFGLGVVALFASGQPTLAWVLLVAIVVNQILLALFKQQST